MPTEQACVGQRGGVVLCGVEDHLDHTFDVAIGGRQGTDIDPQAAGDGRADLVAIQHLPLDLV